MGLTCNLFFFSLLFFWTVSNRVGFWHRRLSVGLGRWFLLETPLPWHTTIFKWNNPYWRSPPLRLDLVARHYHLISVVFLMEARNSSGAEQDWCCVGVTGNRFLEPNSAKTGLLLYFSQCELANLVVGAPDTYKHIDLNLVFQTKYTVKRNPPLQICHFGFSLCNGQRLKVNFT